MKTFFRIYVTWSEHNCSYFALLPSIFIVNYKNNKEIGLEINWLFFQIDIIKTY